MSCVEDDVCKIIVFLEEQGEVYLFKYVRRPAALHWPGPGLSSSLLPIGSGTCGVYDHHVCPLRSRGDATAPDGRQLDRGWRRSRESDRRLFVNVT